MSAGTGTSRAAQARSTPRPAHSLDLPFSLPSRIGEPGGKTSPEELLAAAHGGCITMSLAGELTESGHSAGPARHDGHDRHGRGRGAGPPDRRLAGRDGRAGRRDRRCGAAGGGREGGRRLSVLAAPQAGGRDRHRRLHVSGEARRAGRGPPNAQGIRTGAARPRDAARAARGRPPRPDAPSQPALALSGARTGHAGRAEAGRRREGGRRSSTARRPWWSPSPR